MRNFGTALHVAIINSILHLKNISREAYRTEGISPIIYLLHYETKKAKGYFKKPKKPI